MRKKFTLKRKKSTLTGRPFLCLLTLLCCLSANFSVLADLQKGPYLICTGKNTEMLVLWQLENTTECRLRWGTTDSHSDGCVTTTETESGTYGHLHSHTITGLTPGQKYYYYVSENGNRHYGTFYAPPEESSTSLKFFFCGDTQDNPDRINELWSGLLGEMNDVPSSQTMMIHTGDFTQDGSEDDWKRIFFPRDKEGDEYKYPNIMATQAALPIMGTRGNHENYTGSQYGKYYPYPQYVGTDILNRNMDSCYYAFTYGPALVLSLNGNEYLDSNSHQYKWVKEQLSTTDKIWKIVTFHQPAWGSGGNPDDNNECDGERHCNSPNSQYLQPLLELHNVKLVLNGHNHNYTRCVNNGVHHIVTSTSMSSNPSDGNEVSPFDPNDLDVENLVYRENHNSFGKVSISGRTLNAKIIRWDRTLVEEINIELEDSYVPDISVSLDKEEFYLDDEIIIKAEASDKDGSITRVEFYYDNNKLGEDDSYPYEYNWKNFPPGVYTIKVKAIDNEGNETETERDITINDQYCSVKARYQTDEWIRKVQINDFINESESSPYSNYTDQVIDLTTGSEANVILTPDGTRSLDWKIWIDYNKDGDFEDDGEEVVSISKKTGEVEPSFIVPDGLEGATRMRASMTYYRYAPLSCGYMKYGEIEDYTVNFVQPAMSKSTTDPGTTTSKNKSDVITDLDSEREDISFIIQPNPARDILTIRGSVNKVKSIKIFNSVGQVIKEMSISSIPVSLNISSFPVGHYIVRIIADNKVYTKKLIVAR